MIGVGQDFILATIEDAAIPPEAEILPLLFNHNQDYAINRETIPMIDFPLEDIADSRSRKWIRSVKNGFW